MEDDTQQPVESLLPYERWIANALRHVVVQAIEHAATHGLPGGHHFYITFRTAWPGVAIPARLRAQYPEEMTIILQHQFWDLRIDHEARAINVGLSFGGVPSNLVIPLDALVSFADPEIRYALRFEPIEPEPRSTALAQLPVQPKPAGKAAPDVQGDAQRDAQGDAQGDPKGDAPKEAPQVVSLDAFRRRVPPKN